LPPLPVPHHFLLPDQLYCEGQSLCENIGCWPSDTYTHLPGQTAPPLPY
jgi:hypothetical protein